MIFETKDMRIPAIETKWVSMGVEYQAAKAKGVTAARFAENKGVPYSTFISAMNKYAEKIQLAIKANHLKGKLPTHMNRKEKATLMINSYRATLRNNVKSQGASLNNKSAKWFTDTIKTVRSRKTTSPVPGKLYAFIYDAKHKDTLPFWDKYPLIIYLGAGRHGKSNLMYGLNLHYIPPKARQQMLEDLLVQYSSTHTVSDNTILKVRWNQVKGFSGADKMIKSYLPNNVKGSFIEIKPTDWANVTVLPLQQFVSGGKRFSTKKVWGSK